MEPPLDLLCLRPRCRDRAGHHRLDLGLRRVDGRAASDVAEAFLTTRSAPRSHLVQAAYRQLGEQANRLFMQLTRRDAPWSVDVRFTSSARPYDSADELSIAMRTRRSLEVTASRNDRDRRPPLLDISTGGEYDRFRAVHDIVSHGWLQLGFDRDGEFTAWHVEDQLYHGLARWALVTELHAEHSVRWTTGELADHKALLLEPALVARSRRG